ncbi:MAG: hypothetical protein ACLQMH_00890 [Solirubrobacteraceae bacterium]
MTKPLTPLQQRNQLEEKRIEAYRIYSEETQKRQAAEARIGVLESEIRGQPLANGSLKAEEELETARADYERHLVRSGAALDKVKSLESQLDDLYSRDFAEFAEAADEVSERAHIALHDVVEDIHRARAVWDQAVQAWAGPCRAVRAQGVPPFPIPETLITTLTDGSAYAKPPGIEVFGPGDAEVLDAPLTD